MSDYPVPRPVDPCARARAAQVSYLELLLDDEAPLERLEACRLLAILETERRIDALTADGLTWAPRDLDGSPLPAGGERWPGRLNR